MGSCQSAFIIHKQDSFTCTVESKMKSIHEMTKSTKLASLKLNNSIYVQNDTDYEVDEQIDKLCIHSTKLIMHQKYDFQQQENLLDSILECDVPSLNRSMSSRNRRKMPHVSKYFTPKLHPESREIQRLNISDNHYYNNPCQFPIQETNSVKSILKSKTCHSFDGSQRSLSSKKVKFANGTKFGRILVKSTRQLRK